MTTKAYLQEKLKELAQFHTVQCQLIHERVVEVLQAEEDCIESCPNIKQLGFCSSNLRKWRLGCAHTMANVNFTRLVSNLMSLLGNSHQEVPLSEVDNLVYQIYMLDHTKGSLEKKKAFILTSGDNRNLDTVESELQEVITKHTNLVTQLEECRVAIIQKLDELIGSY